MHNGLSEVILPYPQGDIFGARGYLRLSDLIFGVILGPFELSLGSSWVILSYLWGPFGVLMDYLWGPLGLSLMCTI